MRAWLANSRAKGQQTVRGLYPNRTSAGYADEGHGGMPAVQKGPYQGNAAPDNQDLSGDMGRPDIVGIGERHRFHHSQPASDNRQPRPDPGQECARSAASSVRSFAIVAWSILGRASSGLDNIASGGRVQGDRRRINPGTRKAALSLVYHSSDQGPA